MAKYLAVIGTVFLCFFCFLFAYCASAREYQLLFSSSGRHLKWGLVAAAEGAFAQQNGVADPIFGRAIC